MNSKKVTFYKNIRVYLIPIYYEIENYRDLWWDEYDKFKSLKKAQEEINSLLKIHPYMEIKQATNILYQPLKYDSRNFY